MIYFISFGLGFFGLGFIGMMPMFGIFGAASMANADSANVPMADMLMYGCFIVSIISFVLYVWGQKLLWSDKHETYWIPSLLIMNGLFMMVILFGAVFLAPGK